MECPNCGKHTDEGDRYCPWCGEPVTGATAPAVSGSADAGAREDEAGPTGSAPDARELREFRVDLESVTVEVGRLTQRLLDLERRFGTSGAAGREPGPARHQPPARTRQAGAATPTPVGQPDASRDRERREPVLSGMARQAAGAAGGISVPRPPTVDFGKWNWEWLVGGNWLARIGVVALIFGVAFFISLAIDRGWLGEVERVLLGVAGGLALLGAGEYWRRRYGVWAQTVTGGGLAILYLSVYGAFALYDLLSPTMAFTGFSLITLAGALLSLRHEAVAVAVFSILGGFATPLLLQERLPDQRLLLAYVLVLDVGVLALAGFRNWRWFTLLAWAGSLALFGFWQQELEPSVSLAQIGITAIFLLFAAATVVFHLLRGQAANIGDLALITLNAAAYYGISYFLINDEYRPWMGGFTAALAAFYALMAAACRMRGAAQLNLTLFSAGLAVVFAVLAVPVQLDGQWVSVAWGLEALVLVWMSFPLRMRELRWAGYAMFLVSAVWLVAVDTPAAIREDFTPFLNEYMLGYAAAIVLPALAGWLLHLRRAALEAGENVSIPVMAVLSAGFAAIAVPVQLDGIWITVAWAIEASLLLLLSFPLRLREIRWSGYVLFVVLSLWLLAGDTPDAFGEDLTPFLNRYTVAYGAVILAAVFSSWLLWFKREELEGLERAAYPVYAIVAAASAAVVFPMQLDWPWITVAWAAEVLALVWLSFALGMREIRWFAYVLFGAFTGWLLGWDTPRAFGEDYTPFLNWHMLSYGVAVLASALTGVLLWQHRDELHHQERHGWRAFALVAAAYAAIAVPVQVSGVWITVGWALESVLLLALSRRLGVAEVRWFGFGLLAAMLVRLLGLDTFDVDSQTFLPVLNWRFLSFASAIASLYLAAVLVHRRRLALDATSVDTEAQVALPVLLTLANLVTLWLLSAEIIATAGSAWLDLSAEASENVASLGLSLLWAVYAAALIVLGVTRRLRWVRLAGLALLAVPVIKLFAYDSRTLEQEYRVIAFIALGLIMVAGGLLYQRYSRVVRGFLFE